MGFSGCGSWTSTTYRGGKVALMTATFACGHGWGCQCVGAGQRWVPAPCPFPCAVVSKHPAWSASWTCLGQTYAQTACKCQGFQWGRGDVRPANPPLPRCPLPLIPTHYLPPKQKQTKNRNPWLYSRSGHMASKVLQCWKSPTLVTFLILSHVYDAG